MGKLPEAISHFLQSVNEPLEAQRKFQEVLQQAIPKIDLSAYNSVYTSNEHIPSPQPRIEYTQFEDIKEDDIVVFISYAWDNEEHKLWVRKLSDDLRANGIYTLLDDYNPGGANLLDFMRRGIKLSRRVLVIGSPRYKQKLDDNSASGVNFEDQIMTIEMFNGVKEKFIPVLRKGTFNSSFSELMSVQTGFDFSDDSQYESQLTKLVADLKGSPLNAAPKVVKSSPKEGTVDVQNSCDWERIFEYATLNPIETEHAYNSALDVLRTPELLRVHDLANLVFILCKFDNDGVTLTEDQYQEIEAAIEKKFDVASSFDELHDMKIKFYQTMDLCGYKHVNYSSLNRILDFSHALFDRLEVEKKWLLVICLEQLTDEHSKRILELLDCSPDRHAQYSSMPLFDRVDVDKMFHTIIKATPNALLNLRKFLVERYKLIYPLTCDNNSLEFKEDIDNLTLLHTKLNDYLTTLSPIARISYKDLIDRIEKSILRCDGDRSALVR